MEPPTRLVSSRHNPALKYVRSLHRRDVRDQERAFVVEGRRGVEDALALGAEPTLILLRDDVDWRPQATSCPTLRVTPDVFDSVAGTEHPQGLIAVFQRIDVATPPGTALLLVLDRLSDPGNVGTALRAAAGAGATGCLVTSGTADPYSPKAVRAGMGAHFRLPIDLTDLRADVPFADLSVIALASADGAVTYDELDWRVASALIIGSEAHGPSAAARAAATINVRVPLAAGLESLNAGVAAAIILFEAARQRRGRPGR